MNSIELVINNIKNIKSANISIPFEKGLYAFVGENGCGKSTLMLATSLLIKTTSAKMLKPYDFDESSFINISISNCQDIWRKQRNGKFTTGEYITILKNGKRTAVVKAKNHCEGFYEGSIFYGSRFDDYSIIDNFMSSSNFEDYLTNADNYVSESLGYILHNKKDYYTGLKKIKNRDIAARNGFKGMPYFFTVNDNVTISQYRMSSGESMLISLFDFLNNLVIRGRHNDKLLFLIDEIELALHPSAIDRLIEVLSNLVKTSSLDLVIYFSTHSAELVQRISPKNLFLVENNDGKVELINPCYPNYAIRNLYVPNGFDFLILVEDELAKAVVEKAIRDNRLAQSRLCCVLPAGGCTQMIKLHKDLVTYNTLGVGKRIISIFDGDVKTNSMQMAYLNSQPYTSLPKTFLPILSIEKYLYHKLIEEKDVCFTKLLGDKYFNQKSLKSIIQDYENDERTKQKQDKSGKALYNVLLSNLNSLNIDEERFIIYLCEDIFTIENLSEFIKNITKLLE